jgi:hypothetical protein
MGPLDMSSFITYNKIRVDHQRQTIETLGVMVRILGHGTTYISKGDTDSDSHRDEHGCIVHHQDPFRTTWLSFRCIPMIFVILSYYGSYLN